MSKSFTFNAKTIDGQIQATPKQFKLKCGQVTPIGMQVIRGFNNELCIVATNVLLVQYGGHTLGTNDFKSKEEFLSFEMGACGCCAEPCFVKINDCFITINDCKLVVNG